MACNFAHGKAARFPFHQVGGLLGHKSQATTRTYSFLFDDEAKAAADKISLYLGKVANLDA